MSDGRSILPRSGPLFDAKESGGTQEFSCLDEPFAIICAVRPMGRAL